MFVIRDHVGSTPMSNLESTLTQDMEKIWHSLAKVRQCFLFSAASLRLTSLRLHPYQPDALQDAQLTDYFDLAFTALPHKVLMPEKFEDAVKDLRKRFVDRTRDDFVFKPAYHKRIPADGVAFYMEGIWVGPHPLSLSSPHRN